MSDPVSNVEIEDVLSSIRRLVSDENRNGPRAKPKDEPRKPSRLVLTPSLLVPVTDDGDPDAKPLEMSDVEVDPLGAGIDWSDSDAEYDDWFESARNKREDKSKTSNSGSENLATESAEADLHTEPESVSEDGSYAEETSQDAPEIDHSEAEPDQSETSDQKTDEAPWRDPEATLFEAAESAVPEEDMHDADDSFADEDLHDDGSSSEDDLHDDIDSISDEDSFVDDEEAFAESAEFTEEAFTEEAFTEEAVTAEPFAEEAVDEGAVADELVAEEPVADDPIGDPSLEEAHIQPDAEDMTEHPSPVENSETDPSDNIAPETSEVDAGAEQDDFDEAEDPSAPVDDVTQRAATLSAKIAALEAKIGQTHDQWEPDGELGDDYAGTRVETIEWQDHEAEMDAPSEVPESEFDSDEPEMAPVGEPEASPDPQDLSSDDDKLDLLGNDDAILDEESLRELVADIVRQELQGALGERITRNVRKLVRREIHRALTAQELD